MVSTLSHEVLGPEQLTKQFSCFSLWRSSLVSESISQHSLSRWDWWWSCGRGCIRASRACRGSLTWTSTGWVANFGDGHRIHSFLWSWWRTGQNWMWSKLCFRWLPVPVRIISNILRCEQVSVQKLKQECMVHTLSLRLPLLLLDTFGLTTGVGAGLLWCCWGGVMGILSWTTPKPAPDLWSCC